MTSTRSPERTQRERSEATTRALIDAARARFGRDGYAATSLDDIAADASVSKGAVYHHFDGGKAMLFRAVFEAEQRRIARATSAAFAREADPLAGLYAGCRAFFEQVFDHGTQRIVILEGPAVLGWETVREIEQRYSIAQIGGALQAAIDQGIMARRRVEPLAHMLFGAICEAASMTARSENPRSAGRQALVELRALLGTLRTR